MSDRRGKSGVSRPTGRRAVRRGRDDSGFTLSEMLVAVVLFGIIGTVVALVVKTGLSHQSQMQDRNAALGSARKVVQRVDRDIRGANLTFASPTQIQMSEVNASGVTVTVTYCVQAAGTTYSLTYNVGAGCGTQPKTLATNLVDVSTNPVFSFSPTSDYASIQTTAEAAITNASNCTLWADSSKYDPSCVGTITVHLRVKPSSLNQPVDVSDGGTDLRNAT
jgi:prepilin-type N-terminal cleavage/methylation domain-containing protein